MLSPNPEFIDIEVAVAIHDDQIADYGGSLGLRDKGLLDSALSQPKATFFGDLLHPTISEQAAAYLYHIAKNHAFVDGNKRTALGVTVAFLGMNGYHATLSKDQWYDLILDVSTSKLEKSDVADVFMRHIVALQLD